MAAATNLAGALPLDEWAPFRAVFATARMVALMEIASARALTPCLSNWQLSDRVSVDVSHTAPTPLGGTVTATARFVRREGKLDVFEVSVAGEVGRVDISRLDGSASRRSRFPYRVAGG